MVSRDFGNGLTATTVNNQTGDGTTFPKSGDELEMHYTGTLVSDGTEFDSSRGKGRTFKFVIGIGRSLQDGMRAS